MPETTPLYSTPSSSSSKWTIDPKDTARAAQDYNLPSPPQPARFRFWHRGASRRNTYCIGDPIFIGDSFIPYMFQDLTTTYHAGEMVHGAVFRGDGPEFTIPIYLTPENDTQDSTWTLLWQKVRKYLAECLRVCLCRDG